MTIFATPTGSVKRIPPKKLPRYVEKLAMRAEGWAKLIGPEMAMRWARRRLSRKIGFRASPCLRDLPTYYRALDRLQFLCGH